MRRWLVFVILVKLVRDGTRRGMTGHLVYVWREATMTVKTRATEAFWQAFVRVAGLDGGTDYVVVAFGDGTELATELGRLVVDGRKRATCSLVRDFALSPEAFPKVGDHVVIVDGGGEPLCIYRTTEVVVRPLDEVDEAFAWDEGEGDRTRADWLRMHMTYFARQALRDGFVMHSRIPAVFERFAVVWPLTP